MKIPFSCYIIGEGTLPIQCAEILLHGGYEIYGFISPDSAVRHWAEEKNLPFYAATVDLKSMLVERPFDYLFSIVNNQILPDDVLALPRRWAINYHDALLPHYAGSQATTWALVNQEKMHGISWHLMTGEIDAGDILKQLPVAITDEDTALTLNAKCYYTAIQAFSELVDELATDQVHPRPQDLSQRTYFGRFQRPVAAGILSWKQDAKALNSLVRALNFGTYTNPLGLPKLAIGDTFLGVAETAVLPTTDTSVAPGTITAINENGIQVKTASDDLFLQQLLARDGQPLDISEMISRFGLHVGYRLPEISSTLSDYITVINNSISRYERGWVKRLADLQPVQLPFVNSQYSVSSIQSGFTFCVPRPSPFTLRPTQHLTAVFAAYIARLNGVAQFDMGFSGPAQRQLAWIDQLFAVQMPLRVSIGENWSFGQIEETIDREMAATQKWHSYVLDIWARYPELRTAADTPHILPVMVAQVHQLSDFRPISGCILSLVVAEAEGQYQFVYDNRVIAAETAERIQAQFETLLQDIATYPEGTLYKWQLLPLAEWKQVVYEWNETAVDYQETRFVHQIFESQVAETPDAPALIFEGQVMSYAELNGRANQLARYLQQEGVGPETMVGLYMERSFEMVIAIYAILKAGGAYVPLDPTYPYTRLTQVIRKTHPPVILTQSHLADTYQLPITNLLALDQQWSHVTHFSQENLDVPLTDDNLAYVIYTSGSTGQPKGVMNVHAAIRNRLLWMQAEYQLNTADRVLQKTPYSFDVSVWEFLWPLMFGACLVIARPEGHKDSNYLVETINRYQITTLHFVPSMLQLFLAAPHVESCTSLRRVICSGEALPYELQQRFFAQLSAELHNLYGPTEAAIDVTYEPCGKSERREAKGEERREKGEGRDRTPFSSSLAPRSSLLAHHSVPIGRPIANTQIYILDKHLNPMPVGVPGELYIGGVNLARGYVSWGSLTGERFVPNPFCRDNLAGCLYKTGDLCRWLPDGRIEYLNRIDFQVKIRGFRIELGEIEATLGAHPAVREMVVTARRDRSGQQRLVAYLVLRRAISTDELRDYLQKRLPDFMVPSAFVVLSEFPLTPSGKVNRRALPDPEPERPNLRTAYAPPQTDLEKLLVDLWQQVLHLDPIGIHDNFFELGGDSIKGAVFINALQEKLKTYLYIVALFEAPTITKFVAYLQQNYPDALTVFAGQQGKEAREKGITAEMVAQMQDLITLSRPKPRNRPLSSATPAFIRPPFAKKNKTAVFVLAPPRSGSTLLRVMLGGHPRLFAPPELDLLNFSNLAERRNAFAGSASLRLEGTIRALMEIYDYTAERAKVAMTYYEDQAMATRDFFFLLQKSIGDRLLVDKTPSYALDITTLQRAETDFDQPRYIHLQRHPYGMIFSFEEVRLDQTFFPYKHPFTVQQLAELIWLISQRNILDFLKTIPTERQQVVKFEELVTQPEGVVRQICSFLGVEWEETMIRPYHHTAQRMTDGLHTHSRMLGDVKFHTYHDIDPGVATRWQKQLSENFLSDLSWQVAEQMGYKRPKTAETLPFLNTNQLDTLLANLDGLSDSDVDSLLNQMLVNTSQ